VDNELILYDRLAFIKTIIEQIGENKVALSFSGGKDSTVLHHLIDMSIPNNKIKRVFINTGIEYNAIYKFVKEISAKDDRFYIIQPTMPIKTMLETYGYPFKSKEHSKKLELWQRGNRTGEWIKNYLTISESKFQCPLILRYQFDDNFDIKISDQCCYRMKKLPFKRWARTNNIQCVMTGMMKDEGGQRGSTLNCVVKDKDGNIKSFHPLAKVSIEWERWFIETYKIKLCELYYEPYNFKRTGCKGCPFSLGLQEQLATMELYLPNERKQCEMIWKPIYDEYRRLNYRLKQTEQGKLL